MSLQEGDVIRFDYTLWLDDEEKPVDTSMADSAKEHGILRTEKAYNPLTITVGRKQVIPGLEKALLDLDLDKTETIKVASADAYGERDPKKIQDVPMAMFRKQKVEPKLGMELNMKGERGIVTRVAGGRVRVDTNHDLAGHDLRYEVTVRKIITDTKDKIQAVLDGLFPGGTKFDLSDDTLEVEIPDAAKFDQNWTMAKFRVITELRAAAGDEVTLKLVETYPAMPVKGEEDHEGHDHGPEGHSHDE